MIYSLLTLIGRHVSKALKMLMKSVQANDDVEEEEVEEMVRIPACIRTRKANSNALHSTASKSEGATRTGALGEGKGRESFQS